MIDTIGFGIMWLFALIHVLNVVISAFMLGKPKKSTTYETMELYVGAGAAILFIYALVLLQVGR